MSHALFSSGIEKVQLLHLTNLRTFAMFLGRFNEKSDTKIQIRHFHPVRKQGEGERREEKGSDCGQEYGQGSRVLQLSAKRLGRQGLHGSTKRKGQAGIVFGF